MFLEKLKSLLLKVGVDIRKWKDTLETERNLSKYKSDKGPLSKIYKEFIKLEQRK